jgi:cellulose synthase/poly-beta-1,6-N-acetylglucosamine synthase-like glycosyltransferase
MKVIGMTVIEVLLSILVALLLVPIVVLFKQVLFAVLLKVKPRVINSARPTIVVIMPAHNEHLLVASTIASVLPQLTQQDRLIVVADNCSDDTAKIARNAGAEAIERFNELQRGKGYALDFGVRHCATNPPEVVIIIDADCQVGPDALDTLAKACVQFDRPVQALYLMKSPLGASLKTKIAEFAWLVKNLVRPSGYAVLGLPCQLMGTGMAFTWQSLSKANLASGHIVEDLKLGIDYCHAGKPPLFLPEALVTSEFPSSAEGLSGQRTRWEHGHLGVIFSEAPSLFLSAIRTRNFNLLALAFDLIVPPLALLMLLIVSAFVIAALFYSFTSLALPLYLAFSGLILLGLAVMLSWAVFGRQVISLASLCYAPIYALMKIPVYLNFLIKRQVSWVRSKRED